MDSSRPFSDFLPTERPLGRILERAEGSLRLLKLTPKQPIWAIWGPGIKAAGLSGILGARDTPIGHQNTNLI